MKFNYNNVEYNLNHTAAVEYVKSVFLSTIESRQGKKDDPERPQRVAAVLSALADGNVPQRGSKGSTRPEWYGERTVILKSMMQSAGIEHSLKGDENVQDAIAKLAAHYKRDIQELSENLDQRARDRYALLNDPLI